MMLAKNGMGNVGMIPSWQFSQDPGVNIHLNPHVQFPEGWNQRTVQPTGPFYAPPSPNFAGFGRAARGGDCCDSCTCPGCCPLPGRSAMSMVYGRSHNSLRGLGIVFDSWAWDNRKWLVLGGVALLGLAALGGVTAILR
jgi:hypothetical protein